MNKEIEQLAIDLRNTIGEARKFTDSTHFNDIFISAETIIGTLAYLISPIMLLEQKYRELVVSMMAEGDSHAKAEAKAKASTEYVEWKKYQMLYELGHEQVMLLKKFKDKLTDEFNRG